MTIEINKPPSQYLVRFSIGPGYEVVQCKAWAFSAEDAKFQVELHYKFAGNFNGVRYVGPVNPSCKCPNQCYCGASPCTE